MRRCWERDPCRFDAAMLCAASVMCFFGFLRSGEVVVPSDSGYDPAIHLSWGDVRVDDVECPQYLEVVLKASKTDPFWKGVSVYLGRNDTTFCPVPAVLDYMVRRGSASGPFFRFESGLCLSWGHFVSAVKAALESSGVDSMNYAGNSFRIGAATTAASLGVQDSLIQTLGRWQSSAYTHVAVTGRK